MVKLEIDVDPNAIDAMEDKELLRLTAKGVLGACAHLEELNGRVGALEHWRIGLSVAIGVLTTLFFAVIVPLAIKLLVP